MVTPYDFRPSLGPNLTEQQHKQISFLEDLAKKESLLFPRPYWAGCFDCQISREFRTADGAISFITNHAGHRTWAQVYRKGRAGPIPPPPWEKE